MTKPLSLAVCLFPEVTSLDYQGPIEIFSFIFSSNLPKHAQKFTTPPSYSIEPTYLAETLQPVEPTGGPSVVPTSTYQRETESGTQYDILLVPGGLGTRPGVISSTVLEFIKLQAPGARYVLSVCTGSWLLAKAGVLDGKRATSNKAAFRSLMEDTKDLNISWVKKARWVVDDDNKLWTSSGITAGQDMANAFLEYLIGKENASVIRGIVELSVRGREEDEFAEFYGLVDE